MPALATPSIKSRLERIDVPDAKDPKRLMSTHWMCSNCSELIYRPSEGTKTPNDFKYCPFCGARFE